MSDDIDPRVVDGIEDTDFSAKDIERPSATDLILNVDTPLSKIRSQPDSDKMEVDVDFARTNLKTLAALGASSLSSMMDLAERSEQARSFEVVSTLINTLTNVNKELIDLHAKKQKLTDEEVPPTQVNNTANFYGSTEEILTLLKKANDSDG